MPTPETILDGLTATVNAWIPLAVIWHVLLAGLIATLALSPPRRIRTIAFVSTLPVLSVSALAWLSGNPFNGAVFAVLWVTLTALAARLPNEPIGMASPGFGVAGAILIAFGWVYPHFLQSATLVTYLYASPLGLIPCPTLSALIGLTLLTNLSHSKAWVFTLVSVGLFYGAFGVFRLGVLLDAVLLAGSVWLAGAPVAHGSRAPVTRVPERSVDRDALAHSFRAVR